MAMVFKFLKMDDAEQFVGEVQTRFGVGGQTFENEDAAHAHDWTPFEQLPPIAHIDRVEVSIETEIVQLAQTKFDGRFLGT